MIFATRIRAAADDAGLGCRIIATGAQLEQSLSDEPPALVLVDLTADGVDATAALQSIRAAFPSARVVGFLPHVERELAEQAGAAGADEVVPRSVFVQRLPEWLRAAAAALGG
jgi:DNA-binding NarL/FixJ family response regulator